MKTWYTRLKNYLVTHPKHKKIIGIIFIIIGFISWITPFTPFGILLLVGLQLVGIRMVFIDRFRAWLIQRRNQNNP